MKQFRIVLLFVFIGASASKAAYPISHPDCSNPTASDFNITALFSHTNRDNVDGNVNAGEHAQSSGAHNLIRFDLLQNGNDIDVYFGGFEGILYRYDSENDNIVSLKNFNTVKGNVGTPYSGGDHGLTGIAFHPNFENNRWLFVFYTPSVSSNQNRVMKLTRYEMTESFQLTNEKELLSMEATTTDRWHSGGDMYFNAQGDLFLQVGDNVNSHDNNQTSNKSKNAAWTSGNTTNLIGGVVRIHPDSSDTGYSIPKGNFGEHFAPIMNDGNYLNPSRVKPEIFAKGQRSNFTSTGHPTKLIHIWGEVSSGADEINVIHEPIYGGWPHIQGNAGQYRTRGNYTLNGVPELSSDIVASSLVPNAMSPLPRPYLADVVVGGSYNIVMAHALYYYGRGDSIWTGRTFPPNFHETFMFHGHGGANPRIVPIQVSNGVPTTSQQSASYDVKNLFTASGTKLNSAFNAMIEAKYGPDGALYVLSRSYNRTAGGGQYSSDPNNRPGLLTRIDYIGNCQDPVLFNANRQAYLDSAETSGNPDRYRTGFFDEDLYPEPISINPISALNVGTTLHVKVFNILGQEMGTYQTIVQQAGTVEAWNGTLSTGSSAEEGVYFLQFLNQAGKVLFHQKQVL